MLKAILANASLSGLSTALAVLLLGIGSYTFYDQHRVKPIAADIAIEKLPYRLGEWQGRDVEGLGLTQRGILQLDRYVRRLYTTPDGREVFVYVGYWKHQSGEHQAAKHSPSVCLPANGWRVSRKARKTYDVPDLEPLETNTLVGEMEGKQQFFAYWFFSGERNYAEEWTALVHLSLESFFHGRSDGGIVELSAPVSKGSNAEALQAPSETIESFLREFLPRAEAMLKHT